MPEDTFNPDILRFSEGDCSLHISNFARNLNDGLMSGDIRAAKDNPDDDDQGPVSGFFIGEMARWLRILNAKNHYQAQEIEKLKALPATAPSC